VSTAEFIDCGTPSNYLRANLAANGGESVIGPGAVVDGELIRSVVWPDGVVRAGERLVESIRVGSDVTVPAPLTPSARSRDR
jgi:MurNAc alpha-1-phosphate uridylyltransferase